MQITLSKLESMSDQDLTVLIKNMDKARFESLYSQIKDYPVGKKMRDIYDKMYTKPDSDKNIKDIFSKAGLGDFFDGFRK